MKRNIIGGAFTLASLMLAGHALAEDGVVHFVGEIVDSSCEVTSDTADQTVPLGKVSKNAFSGVGSMASPQQFSIKLEKCPATYTQAAVRLMVQKHWRRWRSESGYSDYSCRSG